LRSAVPIFLTIMDFGEALFFRVGMR